MTVLAAYLPEKGGRAALQLAAALARGLGLPLAVATVAPRPRETPSTARVAEGFTAWSRAFARQAEADARDYLTRIAPEVDVAVHHRSGRSTSAVLVDLGMDLGAGLLVLGSSPDGQLGQVTVGSTAGRLLHSSPLPVALAPRGYRGPAGALSTGPGLGAPVAGGGAPTGVLTRVTCAVAGEDVAVVTRAQAFASALSVPLRVLTLAVRGRAVWSLAAGPGAEDEVLAAFREQAGEDIAALRRRGALAPQVEGVVGAGSGWRDAVDSVDWAGSELLVVGSRPAGPVARVFLGSRATKIVRHAPVPVVVLPG